ncbi:MAG TPA: hypothetical protein VE987_20430 [Polyangiaceae bacterium]|nr:hypothetical protein [Polyangiaceae bacterium]
MIRSMVALHVGTDNLYFGHRTLAELLGHETLTGLVAMAVTGRRPSDEEREVLDAVAVSMNSADPRIWPLKLARLVASFGGTLAGYGASHLSMEGPRIGPWPAGHAARELLALREAVGQRVDDDAGVAREVRAFLERRPRVVGLGVPLRDFDERHVALSEWIRARGRDRLPYWRLHTALGAVARAERGVGTNIVLGVAAVLLDLGYEPDQISAVTTFLNQSVFAANSFEAARQHDATMQDVGEAHVAYAGPPRRRSPRAELAGR